MSLSTHQAASVELTDFPIAPEQIIAGDPVAKIWISSQTEDLKVTQGVWDCTAGDFTWDYAWDEFVLILEGEATIEEIGGETVTLRAGDFGYMSIGTKTKWHVPEYIRKTFTLRTPEPLQL